MSNPEPTGSDEAAETFFKQAREHMVEAQLRRRGIRDERVLAAMRAVPRHRFLPAQVSAHAYEDGPLPIGLQQTISQPYIVALMTALLHIQPADRVLEIGTGSGYQAAVLAVLAAEVHTVERHASLAKSAAERLARLGYANVHVHTGDGSQGWPEAAPYAGILVTAASPRVPPHLLEQVGEGGRLVIPIGSRGGQYLETWQRSGSQFEREQHGPVAFVPLRGEAGWSDSDWD